MTWVHWILVGMLAGAGVVHAETGGATDASVVRRARADGGGMAEFVRVADGPIFYSRMVLPTRVSAEAGAQAEEALEQLGREAEQVGGSLRSVLRLGVYLADARDYEAVAAVVAARFAAHPPALTWVATPLTVPGARVALDAMVAVAATGAKERAVPDGGAILPAGPKVFISGQAERGEGLADSVRLTMASLDRTIAGLGLAKSDVVQVKAFLSPFAEHRAAHEAIAAGFAGMRLPSIVLMEWVATLPVEIELVVAGRGLQTPPGEGVSFVTLPGKPSSPRFSHIALVSAGTPLLVLGGIDAGPGDRDPRDQWQRIFAQLGGTLFEAGSSFRHLVKATYFLEETPARGLLNEIRAVYYDPTRPPAASAVGVKSVGRPGRSFHIDLIAVPRPAP
ncbi:MAG: Rid family hydrolase [Opitutaceae bacterium]